MPLQSLRQLSNSVCVFSSALAILIWAYELVMHVPVFYTSQGWQLMLWAKYYLPLPTAIERSLSVREVQHMLDVRSLLHGFDIVFVVVTLTIIVYYGRQHDWLLCLRHGSFVALGLLGIMALSVSVAFSTTFDVFHTFAFPEGTYTFPLTSTLKSAFPDQFFQAMALRISAVAALLSILINLCWWYYYVR